MSEHEDRLAYLSLTSLLGEMYKILPHLPSNPEQVARDILTIHAHELAAKIRVHKFPVHKEDGSWAAADLIDPEVEE